MEITDIQGKVVEQIMRLNGRKQNAGDSIMVCCPFHDDSSPSAGIFIGVGMEVPLGYLHCFAGEQKAVTNYGVVPMKELVGKKDVYVVDGLGNWVNTEFKCYGKQRIWEVEVTRNQVRKIIRTTSNHRWILKPNKGVSREVVTHQLKEGQYLDSRVIPALEPTINFDPQGIRDGFTFGDGSKHWSYGKLRADGTRRERKEYGVRIRFCGDKSEILDKYFPGEKTYTFEDSPDKTIFTRQSKKKLPEFNDSSEYILGFLAGYFAADGCVASKQGGTYSLSCKDKDVLEYVRELMMVVGINTYPVGVVHRKGYGEVETPLYSIALVKSTVPEGFFLRTKHIENAKVNNGVKFNYLRWKVVSVRETACTEPVYCCEVPTTQSFVLEDNILTGNCLGCGAKGHYNQWAPKAGLEPIPDWQLRSATELSMNGVSRILDEGGKSKKFRTLRELMVAVGRKSYIEWPEATEWRGYNGKLIRDFGGLLNMPPAADLPVCFLPCQVRGKYVGGVAGYLEKRSGRTSYLTTRGPWVKETGLLGYAMAKKMIREHDLNYIIATEGPRDMFRIFTEGAPAVAALGARTWGPQKTKLIEALGVQTIYTMSDNDHGGAELRAEIKAAFRDSPVRVKSLRLPEEVDKKGKLIKVDPDNCPQEIMDEIFDFLYEKHGGKKAFFNPVKLGWRTK